MPNSKKDRSKVAKSQPYEIDVLCKKFKTTRKKVRQAMNEARTKKGNKTKSRKLIEAKLKEILAYEKSVV